MRLLIGVPGLEDPVAIIEAIASLQAEEDVDYAHASGLKAYLRLLCDLILRTRSGSELQDDLNKRATGSYRGEAAV
jgi:hypothetical protein